MNITWLRYVRFQDVPRYEQLGWMVVAALDDTNHGEFALIMEWKCGCRMVEPMK